MECLAAVCELISEEKRAYAVRAELTKKDKRCRL